MSARRPVQRFRFLTQLYSCSILATVLAGSSRASAKADAAGSGSIGNAVEPSEPPASVVPAEPPEPSEPPPTNTPPESTEAPEPPEPPAGAEPSQPPTDDATSAPTDSPAPAAPGSETSPEPEPKPVEDAPLPDPPATETSEDESADGDAWDGDFELIDLTEDKEALAKELEVKTPKVTGPSGTIRGRVRDAVTGQPMIGAYVEALNTKYTTKTDLQGEYVLPIPPGTYELRIRYDTSESRRFSGVVVEDGGEETINAELQPITGAGQTVAVKAEMNRESAGARLLQRKQSVASRDIMSREEMSRTGGNSTSSVAARIVGATIIDGKYVFVRGLGHRYGNTLFDGARVPSPEPELRTVPLDIFPATALSAINVQKTFTPDMPGDFAGASVQLESREVPKPKQLVAELYASTSFNLRTTFRDMATNGGAGAYDAFAMGNIPRRLPGALPTNAPVGRTVLDSKFQPQYTAAQLERFGESMYTDTRVRTGTAPPNFLVRGTLGYGFRTRGNGKIGFLAVASYRNTWETLHQTVRQYAAAGDDKPLAQQVNLRSFESVNNVQWSTVGLVKYDINQNHRISLSTFYSRDADDQTRKLTGSVYTVTGDPVVNTRLRYVMRSILTTQLSGRHVIPKAKDFTIDWFGAYGQARRDDPAMRDMFFTDANGDGTYRLDVGNEAGKQLFLGLVDHTENGALNFTLPFKQWRQLASKFKFGTWVEGKQRNFFVRRFTFDYVDSLVSEIPLGTGNIINDATIGGGVPESMGGKAPFVLEENTVDFDNYRARQGIYAAYAMLELPFLRWMKGVAGARFEANFMDVQPYNLFTGKNVNTLESGAPAKARLRDKNILPSLGLIFSPTDKMNVRLSGTRTVARPEFRELAPFAFTDFVGAADVVGNPKLTSTSIWNADLRWEWFPSAGEVLAATLFYKNFSDPIEQVVRPRSSSQLLSFSNAKVAHLVGFELEMRKNLEFLSKKLKDLTVGFNAAYSYSRVRLADRCDPSTDDMCDVAMAEVSTSRSRPLQGMSPFTANAYLEYAREKSGTYIRLMYNVVTRKIAYVGGLGLPDIYEQPIHQIDINIRQRLYKGLYARFTGNNLLDWQRSLLQGGQTWRSFRRGAVLTVGLGYDF